MTVAAQSHPPPVEGGTGPDHVPSLMALSRQSTAVSRAPTRERVSEAIALVRARQAAESQKSVVKVQDISELRTLRTSVTTNRPNVPHKQDNTRSPLAPAGQTSGMAEKRSYQQKASTPTKRDSFLLNVFASRSEVATTHSHHDMDSHLMDTPEENAPTYGTGLAFMNPLELMKREFQLATQSASRNEMKTATKGVSFVPVSTSSAISQENSVPLDPSLDQSESSDSLDEPVDANTMQDVARFLDQLHSKREQHSFDQDDSSAESSEVVVDAKTMEEVNMFLQSLSRKEAVDGHGSLELTCSTSSDPIDAMRKALSDDFIYGSSEDHNDDDSSDGSTNGSVNPETLAEIGAYIDTISQGPLLKATAGPMSSGKLGVQITTKTSMQPQDAPTYANPETFDEDDKPTLTSAAIKESNVVALEREEHSSVDKSSQSLQKLHQDAPTFANPETFDLENDENGKITTAVDEERHTLLHAVSSESDTNADVVQQTRVSKPSPIYEQVEAKSLTRGAHKDPPSVLTTRNEDQVDPPAPAGNWNEAVMRMHESQAMAPSYSAESLESGSIILDQHVHEGEEKKTEESQDQKNRQILGRESGRLQYFGAGGEVIREDGFEQNLPAVTVVSSVEANGSEVINVDDLVAERRELNCDVLHYEGPDYRATAEKSRSYEELEGPVDSMEGCSGSTDMVDDAVVNIHHQISGDGSDTDDEKAIHLLGRYDIFDAERSNGSCDQSDDELPSEEFDELVDDAGVPVRTHLSGDESDLHDGKASQLLGRYDIIEAEQSHGSADHEQDDETNSSEASDKVSALPNINMKDLPNSPSMKDDNSIPWELKDIASEETMKAGRKTRMAALMPASRSKARKLTSLLSDDSSVPQSSVVDSDHGSDLDDVAIGAVKSDLDCADEGKVVKSNDNLDKLTTLASSDKESASQASNDGVKEALPQADAVFDKEVNPDIQACQNDTQPSNLTFDDCIIEEGEDGVEVLGNSHQEESTTEEDCEEIDEEAVYVDIPANPSGDEQSHPPIDPTGCLLVDTPEVVATKPDPDMARKSSKSTEGGFDEPSRLQDSRTFEDGSFESKALELSEPNTSAGLGRNEIIRNPRESIQPATQQMLQQVDATEMEQTSEKHIEELAASPTQSPVTLSSVKLFTYNGIVEYFDSLHQMHNEDSQPLAQNVKVFQRLVAPFVAGKPPTIVEAAQIRQAAQRAQVPIEVVDRFLDYVIEDNAPIPTALSSISQNVTDDELFNTIEGIEDVNEDEAIGAFLARFGELHSGGHSTKAHIDTIQDDDNQADYSVLNQEFLGDYEQQCESLGMETKNVQPEQNDILDEDGYTHPTGRKNSALTVPQNLFTLVGIAKYFETLDQAHNHDSEPLAQNVKFFQRLVAPIVDGRKPTMIETAQIRQAAQRAQVPIEVVDRFLDYVNEDKTPIPTIFSSTSENAADDELFNEMGDIEDVDEDDAIGAFLTRFGELHRGGHFPDANVDAVKDYIQLETRSGEEAVEIDAEYGYVNKSMIMPTVQLEESQASYYVLNQGFLGDDEQRFESPVLEKDIIHVDESTISALSINPSETAPTTTTPRHNLFTFAGIVEYFDSLHQTYNDDRRPLTQHVKFFQRLVAPFVTGKRPSIIETAQIRQAAQRAQVPIEVVDRFLDYVSEDKTSIPTILSSASEYVADELFHEMEDIEDVNEDEAIGAFLTRFGELHRGGHFPDANIDAVKSYIQLDTGSAEEAVEIDAEYGYVKKSMMMPTFQMAENDPNYIVANQENPLGFLEQYESLEIERDISQVEKSQVLDDRGAIPCANPPSLVPQNLFTLAEITNFFETLDQRHQDANEPLAQNVKFFQRLVAPIVDGRKPTIIETAQIRQAAQRAQVPIEVVDRFLDFVSEDRTPILAVMSSSSEFVPDEKYEEIEDLNEDEAIGAFLTRFGALHRGGHFPDADVGAVENYIQPDAGSGEEAVEVDAEYGFVKKEMMIHAVDDDDDDMEWWKEGQQKNHMPPMQATSSSETEERTSGGESNVLVKNKDEVVVPKKGILVTKATCSERDSTPPSSRNARQQREPVLIVNTRYSNFFGNDEEWTQRKRMATFGAGWETHAKWLSPRSSAQLAKPRPIDGVAAAGTIRRFLFSKRIFQNHQPWKRLYKERTQHHPGFLHVDVNSIYDSTVAFLSPPMEEEYIPWEHREVQQRFLQETSYSFSRNWFGDLVRKRGNQKMKMPVCKPKSMEMPIESVPQAGEWTKEWFTQWKSPYNRYSRSYLQSRSDEYTADASYTVAHNDSDKGTYTDGDTCTDREYTDHGSYTDGSSLRRGYDQSSYSCSADSERSDESSNSSDGSASWEEAPECGEIINVRQKIGERVTRVHPDYTSSLRRSRWRKKYFPRGTFPY